MSDQNPKPGAKGGNAAAKRQLPRRRPVPRHMGVYYRPRGDGKIAPPYEIRYLDSGGKYRWEVVHGNLEAAEARRAELRLRRRRGERANELGIRNDECNPAAALCPLIHPGAVVDSVRRGRAYVETSAVLVGSKAEKP